jgi:PhzF family phenazine biosynthesis protein
LHAPSEHAEWSLHLSSKTVQINSRRHGQGFYAEMDQGQAEFGRQLDIAATRVFASAFGLSNDQLDLRYPASVVSTGLPYVLLPVTAAGLAMAKQSRLLEPELLDCGAAFVFLLDVDNREGRTWDPAGVIEDVATGSAAGPVAAYLVEHGLQARDENFSLNQGRFVQRPCRLKVCVTADGRVTVGGHVQLLARAELLVAVSALG